jgi:transposase InsO family protein
MTDNGREYRSTELLQYLRMKGISHKDTVAYHSQTNAIAERTKTTLVAYG